MGFQWRIKATNAIYLQDANGKEGRPFKSRFLQAGLVKYDFGVCLLKKETIDKFVNTFVGTPVIINHKDNISEADKVGTINNIWFSAEDGWYWCDGVITDEEAVKLIEQGYNVSCQYRITDYADNAEGKLHNANPYDKEILDGVFEHLAIVENPRYEDAFIAVNAYIATNRKGLKSISTIAENDIQCRGHEQIGKPNNIITSFNSFVKNKEPVDWITIRGNHIPIFDGQTEKEAIAAFIEDKQAGGYSDKNKSNRALGAELEGKTNISQLAKKLGVKSSEINGILYSDEWHHTNKNYTKTPYYYTDAYLDLKNKNKISDETIEKYNLNKFQIKNIEDSWKKYLSKSNVLSSDSILSSYQELYKNDEWLYNLLEAAKPLKTSQYKDRMAGSGGIRRMVELFRTGEIDKKHLDDEIRFYSKKEREKRERATNDFNPIVTINKEINYDKVFDYIRNTKGESMDNETKGLLTKLTDALLARNEAEEKDEKDKKDETASNEDTDKRKLIDEVGGILKGKVDEEVWRTIIGKIEKVAYDKSEAGKADNKAKNEEEDSKEDDKKDEKKDKEAENKCKNEDDRDYKKLYEELKEETEKAAENKAKNSMDELVNGLYSIAKADTEPVYISPQKGLELGEQIYGRK